MALQGSCTGIQLCFTSSFFYSPAHCLTLSNTSSGTSGRQGVWLPEEPHESFEVLGGGGQVELLGDIPEPAQAHPAQSQTQLEF